MVDTVFFGRLLSSVPNAIDRLAPIMLAAAVVIFCLVAFEAITHVNPINKLLGRGGSFASVSGDRWGMRRAEGISKHPIFMGMIIAGLFPWVLAAAVGRSAGARYCQACRAWPGSWVQRVVVASIVFPLSRGPILILIMTSALAAYLVLKRVRIPMIAITVAGAMFLIANSGNLVQMLEATAQDTDQTMISIRGEQYPYTGTNHRYLLFLVYQQAIIDAGPFGFGSFTLEKPNLVHYVEPHLRQLFHSLDNHYLVTLLNYGYVGLTTFLLLGLSAVYTTWRLLCEKCEKRDLQERFLRIHDRISACDIRDVVDGLA